MSNVLAIAAVTQLLKDLLNDTLINGNVSKALGADFTVSALPPNRVVAENGSDQSTQLNLFLYRVSPNTALNNDDLPTRDRQGRLLQRPQMALDLHYILTAVSGQELHAEILLGYAMQLFYENGILGRETIRAGLDLAAIDEILPAQFDPIRASELADQIELLKITPRTLSMDDMSKLWTAFQASYRTTVAYDVSLVLIERELPTRPALPVLSRGGPVDPVSGRDPGVRVRPDLSHTVPTILSAQSGDGHPVMRLGGSVLIDGFALDGGAPGNEVAPGSEVWVRFTEPGTGVVLALAPQLPAAPNQLRVQLPATAAVTPGSPAEGGVQDPASWRIGPYTLDLLIRQPDGRETVSNALPLALAPACSSSASAAPPDVQITVQCSPPIRAGQSLAILAGQHMAVLASPGSATVSASATFAGLSSGTQVPVRLRVDGIDSPVIDLATNPPSLETVTIP